jgi:hypothetical protein
MCTRGTNAYYQTIFLKIIVCNGNETKLSLQWNSDKKWTMFSFTNNFVQVTSPL